MHGLHLHGLRIGLSLPAEDFALLSSLTGLPWTEETPDTAAADMTVTPCCFDERWNHEAPVLDLSTSNLDAYQQETRNTPPIRYLQAGRARYEIHPAAGRIDCEIDWASPAHLITLFGPALSFCLLGRGVEPQHGTVLQRQGVAIALVGESGSGKSTLAAELMTQGWSLLSDDLFAPRLQNDKAVCYPGWPALKMLDATHTAFATQPPFAGREPLILGKAVYFFDPPGDIGDAYPLTRIYHLTPCANTKVPTLTSLSEAEMLALLVQNTYNRCVADKGRIGQQFTRLSALSRAVRGRRLVLPHCYDTLVNATACIAADVVSCRSPSPA